MPSQYFGIGASVQFRNQKGVFHEASITKLSNTKSKRDLLYSTTDVDGNTISFPLGAEEKMFSFALRYELGKYFGRNKDAVIRFGVSGGIEPSFYRYRYLPYSINDYSLETNLLTIVIALIPMLSANISKQLSLDFKFIPNFLTADFGTMRENNPTVSQLQQEGIRVYTSPDITWAFSIQMRYLFKEAKKSK